MLSKFLLLLAFVSTAAFAANRSPFEAKTDDLTVNDECETYEPAFFTAESITYFTVGIKGTRRAGTSEEVNITRNEAKLLWKALSPKSSPNDVSKAMKSIEASSKLSEYLEILEEGKIQRGATYHSEGEILEILSFEFLPDSKSFLDMVSRHFEGREFSEDDFFVTGGVTYHDAKSGRTVGELDVIVGDSNTCTIFGIGEAKLGGKKSKAREQLERIRRFIRKL